MTRALIVGSEGQDGRLLFDLLAREGAAVLGLGKRSTQSTEEYSNGAIDIAFAVVPSQVHLSSPQFFCRDTRRRLERWRSSAPGRVPPDEQQ